MASKDLQELQEAASQIKTPSRTIKCALEGIDLGKFAALTADLSQVPTSLKQSLETLVSELRKEGQDGNMQSVQELVKFLIKNMSSFTTLGSYVWLVRTMVGLQLLKGLPLTVAGLVRKLSSDVERIDLDKNIATAEPSTVIEVIAKSLMETIPLDGGNLLHVVKKLAITNSHPLYYIAIALVFAGLDTILHPEKADDRRLYSVQGVAKLLEQLVAVKEDRLQQLCGDWQKLYQLLKLLSYYQNMVLMRFARKAPEDLRDEHKSMAELLCADEQQVAGFRKWLETVSLVVQPYRHVEDEDRLIIANLLHVDMLPLFDDLDQTD